MNLFLGNAQRHLKQSDF